MCADAEFVLLSSAEGLSRGEDDDVNTPDRVPKDADGSEVTE